MRCFSWSCGSLVSGLSLQNDERLGAVVFLGEEGRGRRYEKVALDRRSPAKVEAGRVIEAHPRKVTLPARDGKPEKVFFVLESSRQDGWKVLVRIRTYSAYVRGGSGGWRTVEGSPETVVSGHGAFGDAGRVGSWADGLVVMRPGDVLKVWPSRSIDGVSEFALWVDEDGNPKTATWREFENLKAVAQVEALVAETEAGQKGLDIAFGTMPALTYVGRGQFEPGIKVDPGVVGPSVVLGEEGRGATRTEVALIGQVPWLPCPERGKRGDWFDNQPPSEHQRKCRACGALRVVEGTGWDTKLVHPTDQGEILGRLGSTAVARLHEETVPARSYWETTTVKTIWGLTGSDRVETGAVLLRVSPASAHRVHRTVEAKKGSPAKLAAGNTADGAAGRMGSTPDELWVLRPGEAVVVGTYGNPGWTLENADGNIRAEATELWDAREAMGNPAAYLAKGRAAWGCVPAEWIGRVVSVHVFVRDDSRMGLERTHEGELVAVGNGQIELNLGWDGRDREVVMVSSGLWVYLESEKFVTLPTPERETAKAKVARLRAEAEAARGAGHFKCLATELQSKVAKVAGGKEMEDRSDSGFFFSSASTQEIERWAERAEAVMAEVRAAATAAEELHRQQSAGVVLANFQAWKRRSGATNCGQGWVIRPDGTLREPDRMDCPRPRYDDGTQQWDLVAAEELAILWSKAYTAADHEFVVAKRPASGLTKAQLAAVEEIEREIADQFDGRTGMSGRESPPVQGWGLRPPKPTPASKPLTPAAPTVEVGGLNLTGLFGGGAVVTDRRRR